MQFGDTEAYHEIITMNYKTFWEILTTILVISYHASRFELAFSKTAGLKAIIYYHQLVQTAKTVINYQDEFEHVQTTWHFNNGPCSYARDIETIINYHDPLNGA